jgi:hypothetical protein
MKLHLILAVLLLATVSNSGLCQSTTASNGTLLVQSLLVEHGYLNDHSQIDGLYGSITDGALRRYARDRNYDNTDGSTFSEQLYVDVSNDTVIYSLLRQHGASKTEIDGWLTDYRSVPLVPIPTWVGTSPAYPASATTRPSYDTPGRSTSSSGSVHVRGYYRKDGTYVRPHTRSRPRRH